MLDVISCRAGDARARGNVSYDVSDEKCLHAMTDNRLLSQADGDFLSPDIYC